MDFKNIDRWYINPYLIKAVLRDKKTHPPKEEMAVNQDNISHDIYLPLESYEFVFNWEVCISKLLKYAQIYDGKETENMLHMMNEIVTTYNILKEMYMLCTQSAA